MVAIPVMDAIKGKPGKSSFNNPAFRHDFESGVGAFDDVEDDAKHGLGPIDTALLVAIRLRLCLAPRSRRSAWTRGAP